LNALKLNYDLFGDLILLLTKPGVFFFLATPTNGIFGVDLTARVSASCAVAPGNGDGEFTQLLSAGLFPRNDKVFALGVDGITCPLRFGGEEPTEEPRVPHSFWAGTVRDPCSIVFRDLESREIVPQILGMRLRGDDPGLVVACADPALVIVGLRVRFLLKMSQPTILRVNGRDVTIAVGAKSLVVALTPEDLAEDELVLLFTGFHRYRITRSVWVYCRAARDITCVPGRRTDTQAPDRDYADLFDYSAGWRGDGDDEESDRGKMMMNMARAFTGGRQDEEDLFRLVCAMYGDPDAAHAARVMLSRLKTDRAFVTPIWAEAMVKVVEDGTVHEAMWEVLCGDLARLAVEQGAAVRGRVWPNPMTGKLNDGLLAAAFL